MQKNTISIIHIKIEQKAKAWKLLQEYLQELSLFENIEKNKSEEYSYPYFDSYWKDKERFPFFILYNNEIAGFVFINNYSVLSEDKNLHAVGEFYVIPKLRDSGIGKHAAIQVFDKFPGKWEVAQLENNTQAIAFWRNVIDDYTKGEYKEVKNLVGPVQTFTS
jgi:predicted acetyltransferase